MKTWNIYALATITIWGFWGFFPKLAIANSNAQTVIIFEIIGAIITSILLLSFIKFNFIFSSSSMVFGILTGITGMLGSFFYILAAHDKNIIIVTTLTAFYPVITILLAKFFLNESISINQGIGVCLALIACYFLSID